MTISETDLRLLKSERLTDFSDGGGKMTSVEVVDGQVNNLFNDISQLDRTYGRVSLRKVFASVQTANVDTYLGSHIILTDPPDDPNVGVAMFATGSWTDERDAARAYVEAYSVKSVESRWKLYGQYIAGQKSLMMFSLQNCPNATTSTSAPVPEVGETLCLFNETDGFEQYVRVTDILSQVIQVFTDDKGDFYKDVVSVSISSDLLYTFSGANVPSRYSSGNTATSAGDYRDKTKIMLTQVSDSSKYYGVKAVTAALAIGDQTIKVNSPYAPLVPSSRNEAALIDKIAGQETAPYIATGAAGALAYSGSVSATTSPFSVTRYLGGGCKPSTVTATIAGTTLTDDGAGNLVAAGSNYSGTVDYATGAITVKNTASWSGTLAISATPAALAANRSETLGISITELNRRYVYTASLDPLPVAGSVSVDFIALGKWYRLSDNGNGTISGSGGSGTVNYLTGSVSVTFLAMPDFNSTILLNWGTAIYSRVAATALDKAAMKLQLANHPVELSTLTLSWNDGAAKSATVDASGLISGDASGVVDRDTGIITFAPNTIPDSTVVITANSNKTTFSSATNSQATTLVLTGNNGEVTLGASGTLTANSVSLVGDQWKFWDNGSGGIMRAKANGVDTGVHSVHVDSMQADTSLQLPSGYIGGKTEITITVSISDTTLADGAAQVGTVVYSDSAAPGTLAQISSTLPAGATVSVSPSYPSGLLSFSVAGCARADMDVKFSSAAKAILVPGASVNYISRKLSIPRKYLGKSSGKAVVFKAAGGVGKTVVGKNATVYTGYLANYATGSSSTVAYSDTFSGQSLKVDIMPENNVGTLIHGSVLFGIGASTFADDGASGLVRDISVTTGLGTAGGSIDYASGIATIAAPYSAMANAPALVAAAASKTSAKTSKVTFRIPGAPTSPGSLQINADGGTLHATANVSGVISGGGITGSIDDQTGVVSVTLPRAVDAAGILYNVVTIAYTPLSGAILGVDTVRLPIDGKVPIYQIGGVAVVHNTQTLILPNPVTAGSVHDCRRTLLSYAKVFDANGLAVPTSKYTANLDAGTVTMATPLDLTGYVQPLHIEHRIEDMALISDVQITGEVKLMKPVRHAYAASGTFLSSALLVGDLQAHVNTVFDQATWTSVYSNALIGSAAGASFNDVLYPVTVTNAGCIQERWALVFTSTTAFSLYGEYSGLVASGSTGADFSPLNPVTSVPYFTINHLGWATGWATGNVLRFNTVAANTPLWLARTTQQSDPAVYSDNFKLQIRGDAN